MPYSSARSPFAGATLRMVTEARAARGITREGLRASLLHSPAFP